MRLDIIASSLNLEGVKKPVLQSAQTRELHPRGRLNDINGSSFNRRRHASCIYLSEHYLNRYFMASIGADTRVASQELEVLLKKHFASIGADTRVASETATVNVTVGAASIGADTRVASKIGERSASRLLASIGADTRVASGKI